MTNQDPRLKYLIFFFPKRRQKFHSTGIFGQMDAYAFLDFFDLNALFYRCFHLTSEELSELLKVS